MPSLPKFFDSKNEARFPRSIESIRSQLSGLQRFNPVGSMVLLCAIVLNTIACNTQNPSETETATSPTASNPRETQTKIAPEADPKDDSESSKPKSDPSDRDAVGKIYQDPDGAFEIALPDGYTSEETGSGIKFTSPDSGFKGIIDFAPTDEELDIDRLEGALRQYLEEVLPEVEWQNSRLEPDGSVRVDWVGKSDRGEQLDAVSYIEQRGNMLYTLSLYGVNKAFDDYSQDVAIVLEGYTIEPKPEEPKSEEPKSEETQPEETKPEETKPEEPKSEEPKSEEPKPEEPKSEETNEES